MLSHPPTWALALTYWLHLFATVAWVGSLAGVSLLILPAMQRALDSENQLVFIEAMQRRLEPIAWFSMTLLVLTGLFQMSVNLTTMGSSLPARNGPSPYLPSTAWGS